MTGSGEPGDNGDPHGGQQLLTAGAPALAAEVAVVTLHGRGATAQGIVNLFDPVYRHGVAFLAPQAARSRWFPERVDAPLERNEPWLGSAVRRVGDGLERARRAGVPAERTVLAGFSQGGCVAAEFALRHPARYGGVFVLSGTLPGPDVAVRRPEGGDSLEQDRRHERDRPLEGTPIRLESSDDDPHVPLERVRESARVFDALGGDVTTRVSRGTGHAVTDEAFDALGGRIEALLECSRDSS